MQRSAKIPAKGSTERTSLCGYFLLAEAGMTYKCKYLLSKVRSCVASCKKTTADSTERTAAVGF